MEVGRHHDRGRSIHVMEAARNRDVRARVAREPEPAYSRIAQREAFDHRERSSRE
jgi:hypothetical protein